MILGISAKAGCGKTVLTRLLLERLGSTWIRMSLGDGVKREASEIYGFPLEWCYSQEGKNRVIDGQFRDANGLRDTITVRQLLQYHGTEVRRAEDPEYWHKYLLGHVSADRNIIIDDVRFPDEVQFIRRHGGKVIRLQPYDGYKAVNNHSSEIALDNYTGFDAVYAPRFGELASLVNLITAMA